MTIQEHNDKVAGSVCSAVRLRGKEETRPWHLARASARAEKRRREREEIAEAISLGVAVVPKLRFDKTWQEWEEDVIRSRPTDLKWVRAKLPHRSAISISTRRVKLGLAPSKLRAWTVGEERIVRDNYLKVKNTRGLAKLLPGRTADCIGIHLKLMGLRIPPPAVDTGSDVVDAILERCRVLGYTKRQLDQIAGTGNYFTEKSYSRTGRACVNDKRATQMSKAMTLAVKALGGTLRVDWPDDGESIDTIDVGES